MTVELGGSTGHVAERLLSRHDEQVLSTMLSSGILTFTGPKTNINCELPPDQHVKTEIVEKLVEMEKQAIELEAVGKVDAAIGVLNQIIDKEPNYASAYNNRAQMRRLVCAEDVGSKRVTSDLESAIALALPEKPDMEISKMQAGVLRSAYSQFASVYLEQSRRPENAKDAWRLQLKASDMMVQASNYGERIAATLAAHVNPYAKLCGQTVELVMRAQRTGGGEQD